MYSSGITIEDTRLWHIDSLGNGAAYTIEHKPTGESVFIQGDDATAWREYYDWISSDSSDPSSKYYNSTWNDCLTVACQAYFS